jgi:hypothetical protein
MGSAPLAEDAPAAFIFSRRQVRQRQPVDCGSAAGIGMTWGNSAHQQPPSGWQVIGALHWAQRVSTGKLWREARRASSARIWCATRGRFSCQRGEADAILKCSRSVVETCGAAYFVPLQSLTGNSDS